MKAYNGILAERNSRIANLQKELAKTHVDNRTLYRCDVEAQDAIKNAQAEVTTTKSENAALRLDSEKYQQTFEEQESELIKLKSIIKDNRLHRHELQKILTTHMAEDEVYTIENFVKTKDFEQGVGEMVFYWYDAGFQIAHRQAEAVMEKGESSVSWDPRNSMGFEFSETMEFPAKYLSKRSLVGKCPLDLLNKWEAVAKDDIDEQTDLAPPPTDPREWLLLLSLVLFVLLDVFVTCSAFPPL